MTSTRKVVITEFGGIDILKIISSTCPPPAATEVQITTAYAAFTGGDIGMRKGVYPDMIPPPLTPGYCLTGKIRALGANSTRFNVGDTVAVLTKYDAEAEVVNQPEKYCVAVPHGLDLRQVTALMCDWATAYAMVWHTAKVRAGQRVFVHGLSGSVGSGLMILSRLRGAEVYGTASERNHDAVKAYGAHPFVYTDKAWMGALKELGGADVVFDSLGYESFDESLEILAPGGMLVAFGTNKDSLGDSEGVVRDSGPAIERLFGRTDLGGKQVTFFALTRDNETYMDDIKALMDLMQQKAIKVPIKKIWDMEDVKSAHQEWSSGSGVGSLLLRVGKD